MNLTLKDIELLQTSMGHGFTKAQLAEWGVSPESVVKYIREREWTKEKVLRLLAAIREIEADQTSSTD